MNWLLLTIIIIGVIALGILIYGIIEDEDDYIAGGIISLIIIGLFGFGVVGGLITLETRDTILDVEMTRSNKSIILEDYGNAGNIYIFDKKYDFDNISDTTTFYFKQGYNMYNVETETTHVYYIDSNNNICKGEIR